MLSWQSYCIRWILRLLVKPWLTRLPLPATRVGMELAGRLGILPRGTQVAPASVDGVAAEWVAAANVRLDSALLYFHGGGFVFGSAAAYRGLAARLSAAAGVPCLSLDYRLAPEYPFPAALEETVTAYRWLLRRGVEPRRIILAGDSAGGNLALATLLALRQTGDPLPGAVVCLSAVTDLTGTAPTLTANAELDPMLPLPWVIRLMQQNYAAGQALPQPLLSPLFADWTGMPPMLLLVGTDEILLDDSVNLAKRARTAGVDVTLTVWPRMWHVWPIFAPYLPEARQALDLIGAYIRQRLG